MPEILTESFCERCGTRFTFEAAAPTRSRLSRLKIIARGLRNYVLSDDTTLEEAFADARSDEEREISAQQLEAFHRTFNFCLSCRQYTCANCWNEAEGRCLTCAPDLSREPLPAPFPGLEARVEPIRPAVELGGDGEAAWPAHDLGPEAAASAAGVSDHPPTPEAAPVPDLEVAPPIAPEPEVTPDVAGSPQPILAEAASSPIVAEPVAEPGPAPIPAPGPEPGPARIPAPPRHGAPEPSIAPADRSAAAAEQTAALLARFRPPPAEAAPVPLEAPAEPSAALPPSATPPPAAAQPWPPVAASSAASPPSPEARPPEGPRPETPAAAPRAPTDRVSQPVWPPPRPAAAPAPPPAWPAPQVAARPAGHALAAEAVWAESSRDVLARRTGSVQACIACGLPLSATARFCRRCGSPQQRG